MGTRSSQEASKTKGNQVADQSKAPKPQGIEVPNERWRQVRKFDALREERMRDRLEEAKVRNDYKLNNNLRKEARRHHDHHEQREEEARQRTMGGQRLGEPRRTSSMAASANTRRGSGSGW